MLKTIAQLNAWAEEYDITEPSLLNFAVTDGETVVCIRYTSSKTEEAASLYFSSGTRFECYRPGHYRMVKADRREDIVVVASGKCRRRRRKRERVIMFLTYKF